jgi:hypothetical protein
MDEQIGDEKTGDMSKGQPVREAEEISLSARQAEVKG